MADLSDQDQVQDHDEDPLSADGDQGPKSLKDKYLTKEVQSPTSEASQSEARRDGTMALLGGVGCFVAGYLLSANERNTAYYGLAVVGGALCIQGVYCLSAQRSYRFMPKWVHVVSWVLGVFAGIVFAIAMLD